ncbi:unnamed protein product [Taenia asiatica]|uniref:Uncharacterized protein n=1 Tax=Taenia asiatica TaxID=60517 RepID=A0A3P6RT91_TAEAS|nr:unnamed protein product [Taenia asiatica]
MHPYFADLDKKSLPAVGEECVGLPIAENAFSSIMLSSRWLNKLRMVPSTMLLGASTYQVSAARDRFAKEKSKKSEAEKPQRTSDAKSQLQSLRLNIMMPTNLPLDLPLVISQHTPFGIFHANWWLSPDAVTIIAALVAHYEALPFINN